VLRFALYYVDNICFKSGMKLEMSALKRKLLICIMLATVSGLMSCQSAPVTQTVTAPGQTTTVTMTSIESWLDIPTYYQLYEEIEIEIGELFAIALPRNPRLGLDWTATYNSHYLELVESSFVWFGFELLDDRGNQYFVFKPVDTGITQIEFTYMHTIPVSAVLDEKSFRVDIHPPGIEFNTSSREAIDIAFSKVPPAFHAQAEERIYYDETQGEQGIWMVYLGRLDITKEELIEFGWQEDEVVTFGSPLPHTNKYGGILLYIDVATGEILRQDALWLWLGPRARPPGS